MTKSEYMKEAMYIPDVSVFPHLKKGDRLYFFWKSKSSIYLTQKPFDIKSYSLKKPITYWNEDAVILGYMRDGLFHYIHDGHLRPYKEELCLAK